MPHIYHTSKSATQHPKNSNGGYISPTVEILYIKVEEGFASSKGLGSLPGMPGEDW